jgi:hypothetical protein
VTGCLGGMNVVVAVADNMAGYKITFGNIDNVVAVAAAVGVVVKTAQRN